MEKAATVVLEGRLEVKNMVNLQKLPTAPDQQLKNLQWNWMLGEDTMPYITDDMVTVSEKEAEAYYKAGEELYDMFVQAAQYVIDKKLYAQLGIPSNLEKMIYHSWEEDHLHLYGRFDLAGGIDGQPIKLIEFNADTPTAIPETGIVQWAHLKANGMDDTKQFNNLYESLTNHFRRLLGRHPQRDPSILFTTIEGSPEDDTNVSVLLEAAREAGFDADFHYIHQVEFSPEEGIFIENNAGEYYRYDFCFKLVPWEYIGLEEPDLAKILTSITENDLAVIVNPAYTILFQSKGILKVLWDLFPHHPLLLETRDRKLNFKQQVEKVMFGREGANVKILNERGLVTEELAGEYDFYDKIYQEYTEFPKDSHGNYYQAGLFFTYEACSLGYRRGGRILGNTAQFTGHIIK
ncbi:glutathionylspermidine synthase family protein [Cytophagaceae bacterium ABcell3]|nr:glutathionylspermidine synthase family protein [Cytophagaceae bacterium ABcell3]